MSFFSHLFSGAFPVLQPQGLLASQERHLIFVAILLMLVVVIPVFILTIAIAIRYREGNTKAKFTPNWNHNKLEEFIWWGVPIAIISVLAVITWKSTHELDPYVPIESHVAPLTVEVVALDWKWLFLYPDEGIATVNYLEIPEQTPIAFQITADAPMNSLWIPALSGQIMAMPGMKTQLHILADHPGTYRGLSGSFSGQGFAGMSFDVKVVTQDQFKDWQKTVQNSEMILSNEKYDELAKPSTDEPQAVYRLADTNLFYKIIDKYMMPGMNGMEDMNNIGSTEPMNMMSTTSDMNMDMSGTGTDSMNMEMKK